MFLQISLNGSRSAADHPAVPVTPVQMAADVARLYAAGVRSVHLHIRDAEGRESLRPADVAATLAAIRQACPQMELAVSTNEGIVPDPQERVALFDAWTVLPDTLCVNLSEAGIDVLIAHAHARGLRFEAGLFWPDDVEHFRRLSQVRWRRVLLEPFSESLEAAEAECGALQTAFGTPWLPIPHVLHGMGEATYPMLRRAARTTHASRIGFEDTLFLPDGTPARDNLQLYQAGLALMQHED